MSARLMQSLNVRNLQYQQKLSSKISTAKKTPSMCLGLKCTNTKVTINTTKLTTSKFHFSSF